MSAWAPSQGSASAVRSSPTWHNLKHGMKGTHVLQGPQEWEEPPQLVGPHVSQPEVLVVAVGDQGPQGCSPAELTCSWWVLKLIWMVAPEKGSRGR